MAKKLLLVFGTLVVLVGGLVVYRQYLGVDLQPGRSTPGGVPAVQPGRQTVGGVRVGTIDDAWIADIDPITGRRRAVYRCASWTVDDVTGEYVLSEPVIELYLPSGQTVYISARKAALDVEEDGNRLIPRNGKLAGDVRIDIDLNRLREDLKAPRDQREGDFIGIRTAEMKFDNDLQIIEAPGDVKVKGADMLIRGRGLRLQWHSAPDEELRKLELAEGERMEINTASALLRSDSTAGDDSRSETGSVTVTPAAASGSDDEPDAAIRAYSVVLNDNVNVQAGPRSMRGCDRVELLFATGSESGLDRGGDKPTPAPTATRPADMTAAATTQPADEGETVVITWTGSLVMTPLDPAKAGRPAPSVDEFELHAAGEGLELVETDPDGDTVAQCGRLVYESETRTTRLFAPDAEDGRVNLILANGDQAVSESMWIEQADDQLVVNMDGEGSMTFDAAREGVSVVAESPRQEQPESRPAEAGEGEDEDQAPVIGEITWTEGVRLLCAPSQAERGRFIPEAATFTGQTVFAPGDGSSMAADTMTVFFELVVAATSQPADDGRYAMPNIDRVEAAGNVNLQVAEGGDNVKAESLTVAMGTSPAGDLYPTQADAAGAVTASFDGSTIAADKLTVHFEPAADPSGRKADPTYLTATGDVELTGAMDDRAVRATGATVTCDLVQNSYVIVGSEDVLAKVIYGDEWLSGPKIVLGIEQVLEEGAKEPTRRLTDATVEGEGVAQILLDRDLSGATLDEPVPGVVRWDDRMHFTPDDNRLTFSGTVEFDSAPDLDAAAEEAPSFESVGDHLRCDTLTLTLESEDTEQDKAATTRPDDGVSSITDSKRKVKSILATGDVRLLSRRHDEDDFLISRMQVTGETLDWDVIGSEITVNSPGELSLEDYRAPEALDAATDSTAGPEAIDRPGVTAFRWTERMNLLQALQPVAVEGGPDTPTVWAATMEGGVMMRHRSGGRIPGIDRLPIRRPDPMPAGRTVDLDCESMLARFVTGDGDAGSGDQTSNLSLTLFRATGDVVLRDGPYEAQGGRLVYDRDEQVAVVYGSETGDRNDPTPALVTYEDPARGGRGSETTSPVITVQRRESGYRVTALKAAGSGAR